MVYERKEKSCCCTGHRAIPTAEIPSLAEALQAEIAALAEQGITIFYCGGALGFDTLAAEAVLCAKKQNPKIRLCLALPCPEQAAGWSRADVVRYAAIKAQADEVVFVSAHYFNGCMQKRNRYLAEHSCVCIAYLLPDRRRSGTRYTVAYCERRGIPVRNLAAKK